MKKIIWLSFIFIILFSCKEGKIEIEILIVSNNTSSSVFKKEIENLKSFFENKYEEQPKLYEEYYNELITIESKVNRCLKLKSIKAKKESLKKLKLYLDENIDIEEDYVFNSMKINNEIDLVIFDSILNNDLNRNLYLVYNRLYILSKR
ncbi:hypothetical protein [uncultured Tenacibaculum sp.]|uniref:hypothetical protein n=1 Tax=uncultured Tenacibaculum sp. TaxID=174713 RepID=UPI00262B326A|nr:hypothetical protein [uncultured Tenacibaculum sp.]